MQAAHDGGQRWADHAAQHVAPRHTAGARCGRKRQAGSNRERQQAAGNGPVRKNAPAPV